ncbi:MAG: SMC family ATPase [Rhodothermales bacterium]|nr:SMC family ATPase [Rhodothermales bacterium]MBO6778249.1 SMC family ATPase [Rhodothermales bacterium]
MRPKNLTIHGFASFRDEVEIDFEDADLFVLSGPTGSGKSSIIDAMTFALYGAVPRYGKQATTAIVSKGRNEARVCLRFDAGGKEYTATRVVRMLSPERATTKEARLEQGVQVLADSTRDIENAITSIIGLNYEDFTRCVVLPQGEFQKFMHANPAERQDLLISLLGLGLYEDLRREASRRADGHRSEFEIAQRRLEEDYQGVTPDALKRSEEVLKALKATQLAAAKAGDELEQLRDELKEIARKSETLATQSDIVAKLRIPAAATVAAGQLDEANLKVDKLAEELKKVRLERSALNEERQELPDRGDLKVQLSRREEAATVAAQLVELKADSKDGKTRLETASEALAQAEDRLTRSESDLRSAQNRHQAAHLARSLVPGEPCPVCLQVVVDLPDHSGTADLAALGEVVKKAKADLKAATDNLGKIEKSAARSEARFQEAEKRFKDLAKQLEKTPELEVLAKDLARVDDLDARVRSAIASEGAIERKRQVAQEKAGLQAGMVVAAWEKWKEARGDASRAGLDPPDRVEGDLLASWKGLEQWAIAAAKRLRPKLDALEEMRRSKQAEMEGILKGLKESLARTGVEVKEGENPIGAVQSAYAKAEKAAADLQAQLEKACQLQDRARQEDSAGRTARELSRLLGAKYFEGWMIKRALKALVLGASKTLRELSSGAYSLEVGDQNEFVVIDHLNADERRSAKSLSGGETFLASVSLALALADQVAELGVRGGANLEALFLDEGFGTLDPETLDTVASALEELGAGGRMIGLITHVQDLAERMPVRFELYKEGNVSSITKMAV